MAGAITSAGGVGGGGAPEQSIVTVVDCRGELESYAVIVVCAGDVMPLTVTACPAPMPVCGDSTTDVELVVELVTTEKGAVPPVSRNWNELVGTQFALAIALGVATSAVGGGGAGAFVPTWLVTVGYAPPGIVRPVASVITYVRLMKQAPLVVVVNAPPLFCTGTPPSVTVCGKLTATLYGGVPP